MLKTLFLLTLVPFALSIELQLTNGKIKGKSVLVDHQKLHLFKKVPFAQPPNGNLRFRKLQPALKWKGVLDAREYGDSCMINVTQSDHPVTMSEDCLNINVFTSEACLRKKSCPIFVLVHGGAFVFGNSVQYNDTQILDKFVKHEIIFALPAYRLAFFGFLDLGHDYEDAPYNVGLHDLIANLEWIQKEIHHFGGDPKQVTLMGYSSGATAIQYLLSSPKLQNHKLFSQAMLSSGMPVMTPGWSRNLTERFLDLTNCSRDHTTNLTLTIEKKLTCLRAIPAGSFNLLGGQLRKSSHHLGPQASEDLMPFANYIQMAERRRSIPLLVITSFREMGTMYEPEDTVEHVCTEHLHLLNYYQKATLDACVDRYKDTYNLTRDTYHTVAAMECIVNNGGRFVDLDDRSKVFEVEGLLGKDRRIFDVEKSIRNEKNDKEVDKIPRTVKLEGLVNKDTRLFDVGRVINKDFVGDDLVSREPRIIDVEGTVRKDKRIVSVEGVIAKNFSDNKMEVVNVQTSERSFKPPVKSPEHPCYIGIFAQVNHSQHADDMLYMIGQHMVRYTDFTINDVLMDKYYPQLVRNFVRGLPPTEDWLPTNKKGENYFYLDFEVTSSNKSERRWPSLVDGDIFNRESVDFFLNYLLTVELNASQFHPTTNKTDLFQSFMAAPDTVDNETNWVKVTTEETHERQLREYDRLYGYTSLWTIFLMTGIVLLCAIFFKAKGKRRRDAGYVVAQEPIYPTSEKSQNLQYGAI